MSTEKDIEEKLTELRTFVADMGGRYQKLSQEAQQLADEVANLKADKDQKCRIIAILQKDNRRLVDDIMIMLGNDNMVWQFWHRVRGAKFLTRLCWLFTGVK